MERSVTLKNVNLRSPQVSELARQAGEKIMSFYQPDVVVEWKKDESPLTAADRASHDFLKKSLERLISGVPVISEESDEGIDDAVGAAGRFWLVEPLDGTKEFIKGTN
jgi:3'(2'), 5'-bisphosphate nucleotidase